ncbi:MULTISPECIES: N-acetyl-D-Glu racemase DgcA [Asticcacaulis]|uniref:N-acetyl-D-Glu racemase DgcA n=1 Tax=Asticcacaulis TaxID=76890 RepID=UPI001AE6667B|nr:MULTISPECIES: N-acetyl-D-Glu racemase DgcA [Asticcacaulis]MBP2160893.1 L-alanine-DL-glutamate epimerase-like enolase superfamily enzyme [Asticcacaulis solisilvae]MDR6801903.1 L-alanine-DL-glutamate epimerase-like enolase superfamily enzyme [Asticcacaulis sp. BE141]
MQLTLRAETFPIAGTFTIARGSKTEAHVVYVEVEDGGHVGRGESVPYARYGESIEASLAELEAVRGQVEAGITIEQLQSLMKPGAARNALDCALWDLRAKQSGVPAWKTAGLKRLDPLKTAYTLSLAAPEAMGAQAAENARRPLLKLKIGGANDLDRVEAVRAHAPNARLIVDGNEGLSFDDLVRIAPDLARLGVKLIEQPLKVSEDEQLLGFDSPVPLCADESLHDRSELERCARLYACVNIKLDKTGGLTEALALKAEAKAAGLEIMVGCMVATSLSMAPAMLVAQGADFVDLDGPLLLARDRDHGLEVTGSILHPPAPALWG